MELEDMCTIFRPPNLIKYLVLGVLLLTVGLLLAVMSAQMWWWMSKTESIVIKTNSANFLEPMPITILLVAQSTKSRIELESVSEFVRKQQSDESKSNCQYLTNCFFQLAPKDQEVGRSSSHFDALIFPPSFTGSRDQLWLGRLSGSLNPYDFSISHSPKSEIPLIKAVFRPKLEGEREQVIQIRPGANVAAAVFDNCHATDSNREGYLHELQQDLDVPVIGQCGHHSCSWHHNASQCLDWINKQSYSFVLVFESQICQDYQSDILWHVLESTLAVPVTLGGRDYGRLLPEHSFIDALNLEPRILAKYLLRLHSRPNEYAAYFKWREKLEFRPMPWPCELCRRLKRNKVTKLRSQGRRRSLRRIFSNLCTSWPNLEFL